MAHQNIMFDSFHSLDNTQPSFFVTNPQAYNYAGSVSPQYSSDGSSSYSGSGWGSTASQSNSYTSTQPRSTTSHQSSSYMNSGYSSYTQSSPSYALVEQQRAHAGYNTHQPLGLSQRHQTDNIGGFSILSSPVTQISNQQLPNSVPTSVGRDTRWNSPRAENPLERLAAELPQFNWSPPSADSQFVGFDSSWSDSMSSASSPDIGMSLTPGYNYSLEVSSVAPHQPRSTAAIALRHISPTSTGSSSPPSSRRGSMDMPPSTGKSCSHCHATSTPLWRREPNTLKPLCNACGLYLQQRNKHRPQELIDADNADDSEESDGDGSGPECSHCHTHHTSVWRRSKTGAQLCNACGVYSRLRGRDRPLSLKRNKIKPRSKHTTPTTTTAF